MAPPALKARRASAKENGRMDPSSSLKGSGDPALPIRSADTTTASTSSLQVSAQRGNGPIPIRAPQKATHRMVSSTSNRHNPESVSPSVAALLAMTAIPRHRKSSSSRPHRPSKNAPVSPPVKLEDELSLSGGEDGFFVGIGSPMDMLLDTPGEASVPMARKESTVSIRSDSSDSVPSLSGDNESILSLTSPPTPGSRRFSIASKISKPSAESCAANHPLLSPTVPKSNPLDKENLPFRDSKPTIPPSSRSTTFKSNLTASLRAIKSAAVSLSSFASPSVPPVDLLYRSIIVSSPRLTDDCLPPTLPSTPSPEVRRYFNPTPALKEPTKFWDPACEMPYTVSIQMQEYVRAGSPRSRSTKSVPSRRATGAAESALDVRQQGLRSNSDFVRIWCLVRAMHRAGKFADTQLLKAQRGLPPRASPPLAASKPAVAPSVPVMSRTKGSVPRRWRGISANAIDLPETKSKKATMKASRKKR